MAKIDKDGIYKNDAKPPDYVQFRSGTEVGDVKWTYSEKFPATPNDADDAKADAAPANKADKAPENKAG